MQGHFQHWRISSKEGNQRVRMKILQANLGTTHVLYFLMYLDIDN